MDETLLSGGWLIAGTGLKPAATITHTQQQMPTTGRHQQHDRLNSLTPGLRILAAVPQIWLLQGVQHTLPPSLSPTLKPPTACSHLVHLNELGWQLIAHILLKVLGVNVLHTRQQHSRRTQTSRAGSTSSARSRRNKPKTFPAAAMTAVAADVLGMCPSARHSWMQA